MRWLPLFLLIACNGSDDPATGDDDDDDVVPPCEPEVGTEVELDPDGDLTQIHGYAARDGDGIWVTYTRPIGSPFAIFATRIACDGETTTEPFQVSEGTDNQLDSSVAVGASSTLIAWQSDNASAPYNLDIQTRLVDGDGVAADVVELEAERNGGVNEQNAWMPDVTPSADGFRMAGSWGHDDSTAFQAFSVDLDADGIPVDEATDLDLQADRGQLEPSVTDGNTAWREDDSTGASRIVADDGPVDGSEGGSGPRVDGDWLVFTTASGPIVRLPDGDTVSLGTGIMPAVAAGDGGAMVAWYRTISGFSNRVHVAWVDEDGTVGEEQDLGTTTAAPYPLSVIAAGDTYFVLWSEGANPDFLLKGAFVEP